MARSVKKPRQPSAASAETEQPEITELGQKPRLPQGSESGGGDPPPAAPSPDGTSSLPVPVEIPPDLVRALEERAPAEAKALPPEVLGETMEIAATLSIEYFGHLPPAYLVAGWEKIQRGAADRILRMTENDQSAIIRDVDDRRRRDDRFRIIMASFGATIILAQFIAALLAVVYQAPWWAVAAFLGTGTSSTVYAWTQFIRMQASGGPQQNIPAGDSPEHLPKIPDRERGAARPTAQRNRVQQSTRAGKRGKKS